nr:NADH:flavin oxidoreductase [uncultured Cupriavidus sp.]
MSHAKLFEPLKLRSLELKNRIVMAPMTRSFSPDGIPTPAVAEYYERRAAADVGLIITEGTVVERDTAKNDPNVPNFFGPALPAWKGVVEAVHSRGAAIAPQLWHVGAARHPKEQVDPALVDSPSGLARPGELRYSPMSEEAIADTIAAFGRAAASAGQLGFDAVELHGAHGYLIDQFFWDGTNARQDGWGGNAIAQRTRFAAEIVREVRRAIGPDRPLIIRLSQWKQQDYRSRIANDPIGMEEWLTPLADAGADVFHCSQRRFWEPEFEGSSLNFAGWAKKLTGKPTITVGSVGLSGDFFGAFKGESAGVAALDDLLERLERGEFDLVAVGRALISDPEWASKIMQQRYEELVGFDRNALAVLY